MHAIVKGFGLLLVLIGIGIAFFGAYMSGEGIATSLTVIAAGLGVVVVGALFWCFGEIVDHLVAIRTAIEREGR